MSKLDQVRALREARVREREAGRPEPRPEPPKVAGVARGLPEPRAQAAPEFDKPPFDRKTYMREYMRDYLPGYRAKRRAEARLTSSAGVTDTPAST